MSGWRPIEEAGESEIPVLVISENWPDGIPEVAVHDGAGWVQWADGGWLAPQPTYFQPLPAPLNVTKN